MANRRDLKRSIRLICGELLIERVAASLYGNENHRENADALLYTILRTEEDFVKRVSHPEPGLTPHYFYKRLREDFAVRVSEIADQINNL